MGFHHIVSSFFIAVIAVIAIELSITMQNINLSSLYNSYKRFCVEKSFPDMAEGSDSAIIDGLRTSQPEMFGYENQSLVFLRQYCDQETHQMLIPQLLKDIDMTSIASKLLTSFQYIIGLYNPDQEEMEEYDPEYDPDVDIDDEAQLLANLVICAGSYCDLKATGFAGGNRVWELVEEIAREFQVWDENCFDMMEEAETTRIIYN